MDTSLSQHLYITEEASNTKPSVAISSCLNGEKVRYDGADQRLSPITSDKLKQHLRLIPICPEVSIGMPVPRPPIQLVELAGNIYAQGRDDRSVDKTGDLVRYGKNSSDYLPEQLCGYIFKSKSPSCGLNSTPIFNSRGEIIRIASGIQASAALQQRPWLVLREETDFETEFDCQLFIKHCRLIYDLQLGTQVIGLGAVHQHYSSLIRTMYKSHQINLEAHLKSADKYLYWSSFMTGVKENSSRIFVAD